MEDKVIRLSKFTKVLGIITVVIFMIPTGFLLFTGNIIAALCFFPFVLLGAALLLAYRKQVIILDDQELTFHYLLKNTLHIPYADIHCLLFIPLNNQMHMALISKTYERLISLDNMLVNLDPLFEILQQKNIQLIDFAELAEDEKQAALYGNTLTMIERNYYKSIDSENKTVDSMTKKKPHFHYKKTKKRLKILGWILFLTDVVAYIIGGKTMLVLSLAVIFITYSIYIIYYPYIYVDTISKKGQKQSLQLPFFAAAIAMLINLSLTQLYNYNFNALLQITAVIMLILIGIFMIKSMRNSIAQRLTRKLSVICAIFIMAFSSTFTINFLLTFEPARHETIRVSDKSISSGKTRDYYLYGQWNGKEEQFSVPRSVYQESEIGDQKKVCIRRSMFGLEYYTVHE
ncbi:hypothetical protein [Amedibacillus dolichus]|uniref:Uncharacterized protein n=1 Tax=Amedibacillus dolichus DSM 3991 TaxID=428127 RepID=A8R922_9FIRM|nr:hypothetical protein [Amedibacillus dolichus]EDP11902.1 hypothetical protein EUBDOL_00459 [Amedibacillus dolichus DSM 3991]